MAGFEQRTKTALSSISPDTLEKMSHKEVMDLVQKEARDTGKMVDLRVNGGHYIGWPENKGRENQ